LDKACWMGLIFISVAAVLARSRVNRRFRKMRPDSICTPFGSLRPLSGKSEGINSDILTEIATSTTDADLTRSASSLDGDLFCTEISHDDHNGCHEWEGAKTMVGEPIPMFVQPLDIMVPIEQRPRITNRLEEVDNQVSGAEACNLELEPLASDAALNCNQQNMEEDVLPSKQAWLGTAFDSPDTNILSDNDSDVSGISSDINDTGSATFTRRCTEPPRPRGCSGFVRQRTEELNNRTPAPLFPLLSKHLDTGSGDNSAPRVICSSTEGSRVGKSGFVREAYMELEKVERAKQRSSQWVGQRHLSLR